MHALEFWHEACIPERVRSCVSQGPSAEPACRLGRAHASPTAQYACKHQPAVLAKEHVQIWMSSDKGMQVIYTAVLCGHVHQHAQMEPKVNVGTAY
jgi:hypothetical protein